MTEYRNPCTTVDIVVKKQSQILLIKREIKPFRDMWAFPGGHINYGEETTEKAAARELFEETNLKVNLSDLELVGAYSEPDRDPRGHYITHVYVVKNFSGELRAADDAKDARFFPLDDLPDLAFDHKKILDDYITKFGNKK
ncbi:NUDIX hydrolase [Candidatus Pacearchaeota archaeon]|nr:NUDIX hydrolase [Candidatus Pacearchaeota archaeon]